MWTLGDLDFGRLGLWAIVTCYTHALWAIWTLGDWDDWEDLDFGRFGVWEICRLVFKAVLNLSNISSVINSFLFVYDANGDLLNYFSPVLG